MPSGYGSRLISFTLIDGYAFWKAASVLRSEDSSTADELQWASVTVVTCWLLAACVPLVFAAVPPAMTPTTRTIAARDSASRARTSVRRLIFPPHFETSLQPPGRNLSTPRRLARPVRPRGYLGTA